MEFVTQSWSMFKSWDSHAVWTWLLLKKSLNWALICMHDVTLESLAAVTDHFADAFVRENVAHVYMTLLRRIDFCFEKSGVRQGIFNVKATFSARFILKSGKICKNKDRTCLFYYINTCRVPRTMFEHSTWRHRVQTASSGPRKC